MKLEPEAGKKLNFSYTIRRNMNLSTPHLFLLREWTSGACVITRAQTDDRTTRELSHLQTDLM
jgi:hypothetical protein